MHIARTRRIAFRPKNHPCHGQKRSVDPSEKLTMTDPAPKFTSMGYFPKRSSAPPQRQVTQSKTLMLVLTPSPVEPLSRSCLGHVIPFEGRVFFGSSPKYVVGRLIQGISERPCYTTDFCCKVVVLLFSCLVFRNMDLFKTPLLKKPFFLDGL